MSSPVSLDHRAVLVVSGADARTFLNGLVTVSTIDTPEGENRYGALLTPQGKIIADMILTRIADGFLVECDAAVAPSLLKRLRMFKLRAAVAIEERSDLGVTAFEGSPDPRSPLAPARRIAARTANAGNAAAYHSARIAAGVAEQGVDFGAEDVFPADINMDLVGGIDFGKGCFVGQEVVSRMKRRGTARRRTLKASFAADISAPTPVLSNGFEIGTLTSVSGGAGLARVRIDRMAEALAKDESITAGGQPIRLDSPPWLTAELAAMAEAKRKPLMKKLDDIPCGWAPASDALYRDYHDTEWGVPERDSRALWEKFQLDGFQAGLSWITILRKREEMRREFDGFVPEKLVRWNQKRIDRALKNPGVIRSPIKIAATINNARLYLDMQDKSEDFSGYVWSFVDNKPVVNQLEHWKKVQAKTPLSEKIAKDMSKRGFKFCGPVIVYAVMQAMGMVNDHEVRCPRYKEIQKLEKARRK